MVPNCLSSLFIAPLVSYYWTPINLHSSTCSHVFSILLWKATLAWLHSYVRDDKNANMQMFNRIINIVPTENVDDVTFKLSRPTYFLLFCYTTTHTRGANFALAKDSIVSEAGVRFTCMYSRAQHIIRYVVFVQITSHTIDPPPRTIRSYLLFSGASRVGLASETEVMYIRMCVCASLCVVSVYAVYHLLTPE